MTEQVYKKKGRKYIPIGYSDGWTGFPADGIWIVQTKPGCKSSECIMQIGELESMQPAINLILGYKDKILDFIESNSDKIMLNNVTRAEFVETLLKEISKK